MYNAAFFEKQDPGVRAQLAGRLSTSTAHNILLRDMTRAVRNSFVVFWREGHGQGVHHEHEPKI